MIQLQSISFRPDRFFAITILSFVILYFFSVNKSKEAKVVIYLTGILFFIYEGIGASFSLVPDIYLIYYFGFLFLFFYIFSKIAFQNSIPGQIQIKIDEYIYNKVFSQKNADIIILFFLTASILYCYYPDFDFGKLVSVPRPKMQFSTLSPVRDPVQQLLFYIILLIQPLYFISLIRYKHKVIKLFILLFLPLYFTYTQTAYIGRSTLLPYILIYFFTIYHYNATYRRVMILLAILLFFPSVIMLYNYTLIRLGANPSNSSLSAAFNGLFSQELTFPVFFQNIFKSEHTYNAGNFFLWMATLPLPSFIKVTSMSYTGNFDISEIILRLPRNDSRYFVLLAGTVTESVYVFGKYFAFIMPVLSGFILGFAYRMIALSKHFNILKLYLLFCLCTLFARAGSGAIFPNLLNAFLFFYLIAVWIYYKIVKQQTVPQGSL